MCQVIIRVTDILMYYSGNTLIIACHASTDQDRPVPPDSATDSTSHQSMTVQGFLDRFKRVRLFDSTPGLNFELYSV